MIILDLTVVNIALPHIQHGLRFPAASLSWVLNAYSLTFGGLLLLGGRLGDILGRRRVFMAGLAIFTLASLAGGLATSAPMLLAARAVQGVGGAIASPAVMLLALCNEVPEADVDQVTHALTYRLGRRFLKGAVPYGGPCWPRDNRAMAAFMDLIGVPSILPNAVDRANADHGHYVLSQVLNAVPRGRRVGVLGLAYKPRHADDRSFVRH